MTPSPEAVRVDIVSDVVCPWCAIGYYQLAAASRSTGIPVDVHWHPFELNPHMPDEGQDIGEHLAMKYGTTPEGRQKARARLSAIGEELGFAFNYTDDMRIVNTFRAHQLIDWAEGHGKAHQLKLALLAAYFTELRDVSNPGVLIDVAQAVSLEADAAGKVLASGERAQKVREHQEAWAVRGIYAVPAMVFGEKKTVTGAQGEAMYARLLQAAVEASVA